MSLGELLSPALAGHPDATAVVDGDRRISYKQLEADSNAIAGGLASSFGVKPGDRVAVLLPNGYDFVRSYLGTVKAGAAVVPINVLLQSAEVAHILADSGAVGLITGGPLEGIATAVGQKIPSLRALITTGRGGDGFTALDELGGQPPGSQIDDESHIAAIIYTSGTTGKPKGACLSHGNLLSNVSSCQRVLLCSEGERFLCVLPMFHSFAMTVCVLLPLSVSGTCVSMMRFSPREVLATIAKERVTIFAGVPSMFAVWTQTPVPEDLDLSSWRLAVSGGAALPPAVLQGFEKRFGMPLVEGMGLTECSPVTTVNPPNGVRKPGSIGQAVPDVNVRVMDGSGKFLPTGEVGELVVRGPNVMVGYWNMPEATAEAMRGGWLHTGDLGRRDEDGYFYIVDRLKDMIISGGMNVYPREVEDVLYSHPAVAEAAVIGEPHPLRGEVPVAVVKLRDGAPELDPRDIARFCGERLAAYKVPKDVRFVEQMPKTATGKVLKRALREAAVPSTAEGGGDQG